jgi:hypothetical protein
MRAAAIDQIETFIKPKYTCQRKFRSLEVCALCFMSTFARFPNLKRKPQPWIGVLNKFNRYFRTDILKKPTHFGVKSQL